ncbi:MAG: four helix bundle protein [Verrucomicrobia bacterium]|nr:four helix bundle protein [Verrucomicrobiota bacterium]
MSVGSAKELDFYKAAYELAMRIFKISKSFPPEERYALRSRK